MHYRFIDKSLQQTRAFVKQKGACDDDSWKRESQHEKELRVQQYNRLFEIKEAKRTATANTDRNVGSDGELAVPAATRQSSRKGKQTVASTSAGSSSSVRKRAAAVVRPSTSMAASPTSSDVLDFDAESDASDGHMDADDDFGSYVPVKSTTGRTSRVQKEDEVMSDPDDVTHIIEETDSEEVERKPKLSGRSGRTTTTKAARVAKTKAAPSSSSRGRGRKATTTTTTSRKRTKVNTIR